MESDSDNNFAKNTYGFKASYIQNLAVEPSKGKRYSNELVTFQDNTATIIFRHNRVLKIGTT
jgi:hypothetical protein